MPQNMMLYNCEAESCHMLVFNVDCMRTFKSISKRREGARMFFPPSLCLLTLLSFASPRTHAPSRPCSCWESVMREESYQHEPPVSQNYIREKTGETYFDTNRFSPFPSQVSLFSRMVKKSHVRSDRKKHLVQCSICNRVQPDSSGKLIHGHENINNSPLL